MSQSIRFLGLAIFAWAGVRAASLGLVPGADALAIDRVPATASDSPVSPNLPPIAETMLPQIGAAQPADVLPPSTAGWAGAYPYAAQMPWAVAPNIRYVVQGPLIRPVAQSAAPTIVPQQAFYDLPPGRLYPERPVLDEYPTLRMAASAPIPPQSTPPLSGAMPPPVRKLDRLQLSSWAMIRERPGPQSLAGNGMLGGSQAGARLLWRFDRRLAVSVRTTTPLQSLQRGTEFGVGVRYQPFASIPVAVTAERRQWVGKTPGRSAFALFAEGGVYGKSLPMGMKLDSYLQAGIVDPRARDWFVDGSATATRPVWRNLGAGVGVWGGAQRGLARIEAGPRVSFSLGRGMKAHADYRLKLAGKAEPGSGAVVTLAGDF